MGLRTGLRTTLQNEGRTSKEEMGSGKVPIIGTMVRGLQQYQNMVSTLQPKQCEGRESLLFLKTKTKQTALVTSAVPFS